MYPYFSPVNTQAQCTQRSNRARTKFRHTHTHTPTHTPPPPTNPHTHTNSHSDRAVTRLTLKPTHTIAIEDLTTCRYECPPLHQNSKHVSTVHRRPSSALRRTTGCLHLDLDTNATPAYLLDDSLAMASKCWLLLPSATRLFQKALFEWLSSSRSSPTDLTSEPMMKD